MVIHGSAFKARAKEAIEQGEILRVNICLFGKINFGSIYSLKLQITKQARRVHIMEIILHEHLWGMDHKGMWVDHHRGLMVKRLIHKDGILS